MANPLQQAGAVADPSRYAPIHTNRFFTGLWTQRNPLRDAATPYLYEKFYSGSRFESLLGGANVELTSKLTLRRRRGHSVYNSSLFPSVKRFYEFRQQIAGVEVIKLIADTAATVYDATGPNTKTALFAKSAGAGSALFQQVGNSLYFGDGVDQKKLVSSTKAWAAATAFVLGDFIVDPNLNIQQVTTAGTSGAGPGQPAWNAALRGTTADNTIVWTNRGNWVGDTQLPAPATAPGLGGSTGFVMFWQPNLLYVLGGTSFFLLDLNGNIQQMGGGGIQTGMQYPNFSKQIGGITTESSGAGNTWTCRGPYGGWAANQAYVTGQCIVDVNGNIQQAQNNFTSAATQPAWATVIGNTTVDNGAANWKNMAPGAIQVPGTGFSYAYSWHSVDGSLTTASPEVEITGPVIGTPGGFNIGITITGNAAGQVDKLWLFRTSAGGSTLLFNQAAANTGAVGITVTDTLTDAQLNPLLQAPIDSFNDPPPAGFKPMAYHLGCVFGAVGNTVFYSNGGHALFGSNANTAFSPNNFFIFPSSVVRMQATSIGVLVFTVSDIYIILGQNTSSSPLYSAPFLQGIGLLNYDALTVNGSTFYLMTADSQVVQLDPGAGVVEVGFPIGDQFETLYNPATAFLTWHTKGSSEKALYVADGATGWFRMNPTPAPEAGIVWSPQAQIAGGCGIAQSVEVSPGSRELLIQTGNNTPILKRDAAVTQDNGTSFAMNTIIGSIVLAQPGQLAEILFLTLDSVRIGSKPTVGVLLGEIAASAQVPFEALTASVVDPPNFAESATLYSDRYYMAQEQNPVFCRHLQIQFTWATEAAASELLTYTLYGALHPELRQ